MRKLLILACTLVLTSVWALSAQAGEAVAKPKESMMAAKLSHVQAEEQAEKIRQLLLADLQRVVWLDKGLRRQFNPAPSASQLAELSDKDKEKQFFAAVVLAAHGNSSGAEVLRRYQDYFKTEFGIEGLHALAALALIGQAPEKTPMGAYWRQLSPRLTAELTRYIDETQPVFPAPTSNSTVNRKAETLGYLLLGEIDHIDRFEGWMDSLRDLPLSAEIHTRLKQSLSAKNRKEQFLAAVLLAADGDASGADILHHHERYYITSSGFENVFVRAALMLIDQDKGEGYKRVEISMGFTHTDDLAKALTSGEPFTSGEQVSKEKIRRLLLAKFEPRGYYGGSIFSYLLDPRHSPQLLARLKQLLSDENKEGQFFAAIFLAAHGDASGAEILHHYFTTESGIEGLQALAALVLIDQAPEKTPMKSLNWVTMSRHLTAELAEYIDGGIFGSKPVWPEPARPEKAKMGAALDHERAQNVRKLLLDNFRWLVQPHNPLREKESEWIAPLLDQEPSAKLVAQLKRQLSDKNKEKQFFAAVLLAAHGDASGVNILRNYQDYHLTETGLESLHALAALALIGQAPEKTPMGTPRWMIFSSELVAELADYIGGAGGGLFFSMPVP